MRLHSHSAPSGLERDKFDNKTVSFEEHIKLEHNMWNYLYFIVLVRVKNRTDYTGPESYVAQMIKVRMKAAWGGGWLCPGGSMPGFLEWTDGTDVSKMAVHQRPSWPRPPWPPGPGEEWPHLSALCWEAWRVTAADTC